MRGNASAWQLAVHSPDDPLQSSDFRLQRRDQQLNGRFVSLRT